MSPDDPTLRAVVYIRRLRDLDACQRYVSRRGYRLVGVVLDRAGDRYHREVLEAALRGDMEVVVIRRLADLPADRIPRTEVAEDERPTRQVRSRRPRRL